MHAQTQRKVPLYKKAETFSELKIHNNNKINQSEQWRHYFPKMNSAVDDNWLTKLSSATSLGKR